MLWNKHDNGITFLSNKVYSMCFFYDKYYWPYGNCFSHVNVHIYLIGSFVQERCKRMTCVVKRPSRTVSDRKYIYNDGRNHCFFFTPTLLSLYTFWNVLSFFSENISRHLVPRYWSSRRVLIADSTLCCCHWRLKPLIFYNSRIRSSKTTYSWMIFVLD